MFSQVGVQAHAAEAKLQRKIEQSQKGLELAARKLGGRLVDVISLESMAVVDQQQQIRREEKAIRPHIAEFKMQTRQWSEAIKDVDEGLRELGDVENLLSVMKEELNKIKTQAQGM